MEFDPIAYLSIPTYAAQLVATTVIGLGFIVFSLPSKWSASAQILYWRIATFLAEILVAVGLIGLITFAGRAKVESNSDERAMAVSSSEQAFSQALLVLTRRYCTELRHSIPPLRKVGPIYEACKTSRELAAMYKPGLDWQNGKRQLEYAASAARETNPDFSRLASAVAAAIDVMVSARAKVHQGPLESQFIRSNVSWAFILICAVFAAIGVSIKCARACRDLTNEVRIFKHSHAATRK